MADEPTTVIVDRGSGGGAGWVIAIVLLIAVLIGGFYLFSRSGAENSRDAAITSAAHSVGGAADRVSGSGSH